VFFQLPALPADMNAANVTIEVCWLKAGSCVAVPALKKTPRHGQPALGLIS